MLKKSHLLISSIIALGTALHAEEAATPAAAESVAVVTEPVAVQLPAEPAAPAVEVSDAELIELIGYLTAQNGGIATLQLDDAGIAALADGLQKGLAGKLKLQDFPQAVMQAAFAQAGARAQAVQAGTAELPAIDTEALQQIGLVMVAQSGLVELGFGADDAAGLTTGFIAGASATEVDPAMQTKMPALQAFMEPRVAAAQAALAEAQTAAAAQAEGAAAENIAAGKAFIAGLSADGEVQKSESGLHFKVLEAGSDAKPTMADRVLVHYKGTLIDGTPFDSSYDRGAPTEFPLGGVVEGFGEGLTKVGAGGKIILYIPSELGYGSQGAGALVKPGATLIFECELVEINPGS
jgi:FKBP-type peptidyl-prolyl cis-trans isomerase